MITKTGLPRQLALSAIALALLAALWVVLVGPTGHAAEKANSTPQTDNVAVSQAGQKDVQIRTALVRSQSLDQDVLATGQITYPADQTIKVSPRLQGRIREVCVRVGDHVTTGQTLATLDSVDAATAQANARQTNNKLRLARLNLLRQERLLRLGTPDVTAAQATLDQATAGARSAKDTLDLTRHQAMIGGFTQKPLEDADNALISANSALSQAQSDLAQAQRDFDRKSQLVQIGVAARSDLEAAQTTLEKARVNVAADQQSVQIAKQAREREQRAYKANLYADQQVRQAENAYRQARLQVDAAERALRLAKAQILRDLQQARSDYEAAQVDAQNAQTALRLLGEPEAGGLMRISSPIGGVVVERDVNPGQVVDQSQMTPWQMFVISNADTLWVDTDVYEKDIASVHGGEGVRIRVPALGGKVLRGTVSYIAPGLDPKTHAVKVRTSVRNMGGLLKDGMYVEVLLHTGRSGSRIVIPLDAVQHNGDEDYVYVERAGKYVKRAIKVGGQQGQECVVASGLTPGERVVTQGALFLGAQ